MESPPGSRWPVRSAPDASGQLRSHLQHPFRVRTQAASQASQHEWPGQDPRTQTGPTRQAQMNQICSKCKVEQPASNFYAGSKVCKVCRSEYNKKYHAANRAPRLAAQRARIQGDPEAREKVRLGNKRHKLMSLYGITLEQYDEMLEAQNGVCAICESAGRLCVDHDHETNRVRGLLCVSCNRMLGLAKDDPKVLLKGSFYLERNS